MPARSFDHREPGTSAATWLGDPHWTDAPELPLTGADHLLVVAAHPDDETLGAGGALAAAAAAGLPATVVVATDGEHSHPDSPTHSAAELAVLRRREVSAAAELLHPRAGVLHLGLADGKLADRRSALEAALAGRIGPRTLVLAPWRGDGHPDHTAAGTAAARCAGRAGARLLEYPIWLWHWGTPEDVPWPRVWRRTLTPEERAAKHAAIAAHRSQIAALSPHPGDEAVLPAPVLEHFRRPFEAFLGTGPDIAVPFDRMLEDSDDPWQARSSWYERRKRMVTTALLPHEHYGTALELGCATGELAEALAERAGDVLAVDASRKALQVAESRRVRGNVRYRRAVLPDDWPGGRFDLIVLSELGYYCTQDELGVLLDHAAAALAPGGTFLACHWRHPVEHWPLDGDDVHRQAREHAALTAVAAHREQDFRIDVFARRDDR